MPEPKYPYWERENRFGINTLTIHWQPGQMAEVWNIVHRLMNTIQFGEEIRIMPATPASAAPALSIMSADQFRNQP